MSVRLTFHGAARTVTGSCYLLDTGNARILVDCGMFQGSKTLAELNYRSFPFEPVGITALLLTHAHIDHSGVVPKLVKHGFRGPIHATSATADLCSVMLPDSGHIQEVEVRQLNERNRKRGRPEVEPIYTAADAEAAAGQFRTVEYGAWITPADGVRARYWNAGHLLGSASIEVEVAAPAGPLRLLFSGDIGPANKLLEPDPTAGSDYDYVVCESTYGATDRADETEDGRRQVLAAEIRDASKRGGALLIPSFAVERTQELMTDLTILIDSGALAPMPVFIDSPLAYRATAFFRKHAAALDNGELLLRAFNSSHVRLSQSVEDSKALNRLGGFHVVIAASGMCEAGRIRHHLRNRLWQPNTTVLLAGYQAEGTLGRLLEDGAKRVRIQGEEILVKARIRRIDDYSGHADGPELVAWLKSRLPVSRGVFLTHGEDPAMDGLTAALSQGVVAADLIFRPALDECFDLTAARPELVPAETRRRIEPAAAARLDWHNDLTKLILDVNEAVAEAADEKARGVILRRLRRALEEGPPPGRG